MKTIKTKVGDTTQYSRVSDVIAERKVLTGEYQYCPKSEWKQNVRDLSKTDNSK